MFDLFKKYVQYKDAYENILGQYKGSCRTSVDQNSFIDAENVQREKIEEEQRQIGVKFDLKLKNIFLGRICYIDSNFFMSDDDDVDALFNTVIGTYEFTAGDYPFVENNIIVIKEQYNELYKLKSSAKDDVSYKARIAFRRIEELHSKKILKINSLDQDLKGDSYADIAFIEEIVMQLKKGFLVSFLTEDLDLKIRLNMKVQSLSSDVQKRIQIYSIKDIEV